MLAALAIEQSFARFGTSQRRHWLLAGGVILLLTMSLGENIQTLTAEPVHIAALYYQIGADKRNTLLLDLPIAARGSDHFYQITHHKRLVAGYSARPTEPQYRSVQNVPYLSLFDYGNSRVAGPAEPAEAAQGADIYPLPETMLQSMAENGIGYVILHTRDLQPTVASWSIAYLLAQLGTPFYANAGEGLMAWHITAHLAPDPTVVHFKMGSGWVPGMVSIDQSFARYVQQDAQLLISVPVAGNQHIQFMAMPVAGTPIVTVSLNGVVVAHVTLANSAQPTSIDLGSVPLVAGENTLTIHSSIACIVMPDETCHNVAIMHVQLTPTTT